MVLMKTLARVAGAVLALHAVAAQADAVTEWNAKLAEIVAPTPIGAVPPAMVHTAVYRAVNAISRRYPEAHVDPLVAQVRALGARASTQRNAEQSDIARFWVGTASIFHPLLQDAVSVPGREVTANARLLALALQTQDDAAMAFFEAKYHYMLWRPLTAIRNGDQDGNDATERDARWSPLIETPMHPEYPCAHCAAAAALASVLKAELGSGPWPPLRLPSQAVAAVVRQWADIDAMVTEVSNSRVWGGAHYRFSTIAGEQVGKRVVELALARFEAR